MVAKVAKERVESARYVGFLSSFLANDTCMLFYYLLDTHMLIYTSYIHLNLLSVLSHGPTATQCGKGGKGGVATDSLERFCEICTAKYPGFEDAAEGSTAAVSAATKAMATTDPSSLSTGQIAGIAVGGFVAFCTLIRLIKCCCSRKKLD